MAVTKGSTFACNPATTRGVSTKLSADAKGENIVYVNGRTVIIRNLKNPSVSVTYSGHVQPVTVARISPSGFYCASADIAGNIRVWDIAGTDQILKLETKPLAGRINDLAWDGESKRIVAVGDGRERFGAAFTFDTGSSCGEIMGSSKVINAVDIRQQRPFRAATASDDSTIIFFTGVPFKYDKTIRTHSKYVQDVKFSGNGEYLASVGSDGKLFLYDGKDGSTVAEIAAHQGSIMACSWSPDSKQIATAGADRSVKIWDATSRALVHSIDLGNSVEAQQVGIVWASEDALVSLSLGGALNLLNPQEGKITMEIHGATKSITASVLSHSPDVTFFTGSFDGAVKAFDLPSGSCRPVEGTGHSGKIVGLAIDDKNKEQIWSAAWGSPSLQLIKGNMFTTPPQPPVDSPQSVAVHDGVIYFATSEGLVGYRGESPFGSVIKGSCSVVVAASGIVAYGGAEKKVHLCTVHSDGLKVEASFDDSRGEILSLAISNDGKYLAAGDSSGRIILIDINSKTTIISSKWTAHTGRVNSLGFSPDCLRLASGSLDESVIIWSVMKTLRNLPIKNTHAGGVAGVAWLDDETIISAGADSCVRTWVVKDI